MISRSKKLDLIFTIILISMLVFGVGYQLGYSFTGTTNTFAVGSLETSDVNFTGSWYRGSVDLTDRLLGDWAINLNATTLNTGQGENELYDMDQNVLQASGVTFGTVNTGQGANELYDMDQNVDTGSNVLFNDLNITSEIYWNDENRTDQLANPDLSASYIIATDGITITAKNGSTGQIEFSGTDAATVIQNAIDGLPDYVYPVGGGHIYVKYGNYEISSTIQIDKPIILEGEGRWGRTIFTLANGANSRLLQVNVSGGDFWSTVKNMHFEGNKAQQTGGDYLIYYLGGYPVMENVYIMNAYGTGIYLHSQDFHFYNVYVEFSNEDGWNINFGQNGQLYSCTAWANGNSGMRVEGGRRGTITNPRIMKNEGGAFDNAGLYFNTANRLQVIGGYINENNGSGIDFYNSDNMTISGVTIKDNSQKSDGGFPAVKVRGSSEKVTLIGNHIYSTDSSLRHSYSIEEANTVDKNLYLGNQLHGAATAEVLVVGSNSQVKDNLGFSTDNSGTQTCADNENIAHGLAGTPTFVGVTPMNNTYDGVPVIANVDWTNVDGTNIQVGLYWTNGTAIATDIILVAWSATYEP